MRITQQLTELTRSLVQVQLLLAGRRFAVTLNEIDLRFSSLDQIGLTVGHITFGRLVDDEIASRTAVGLVLLAGLVDAQNGLYVWPTGRDGGGGYF